MTDLKETLSNIAKAIVDSPDEVIVSETVDGKKVNLVLNVAEDDMGRIIGKQGRIAKAIRTIARSAAIRSEEKIMVEID